MLVNLLTKPTPPDKADPFGLSPEVYLKSMSSQLIPSFSASSHASDITRS